MMCNKYVNAYKSGFHLLLILYKIHNIKMLLHFVSGYIIQKTRWSIYQSWGVCQRSTKISIIRYTAIAPTPNLNGFQYCTVNRATDDATNWFVWQPLNMCCCDIYSRALWMYMCITSSTSSSSVTFEWLSVVFLNLYIPVLFLFLCYKYIIFIVVFIGFFFRNYFNYF